MSAHVPTDFGWSSGGAASPGGLSNRRARRVLVLLAGVVALSMADLLATIAHLRIGMIEGNPLARYIIETTQSMNALAAFKVATVAVCVTLLYRLRRSRQGEMAAWAAIVILGALIVWWGVASGELTGPDAVTSQMLEAGSGVASAGMAAPLPAP